MSTATPGHVASSAEARLHELRERTLRSIEAVGSALQAVDVPTSPPVARSVQAAENAWRDIEREFGLLSSTQVGELLGSRSRAARNVALDRHRDGRLIGVRRGNALRFPAFQLDEHGQVRPGMARLRQLAGDHGWSEPALVLWLCSPNDRLDGDRPVDRITDTETLLQVANDSLTTSW